MQDKIVQAEEYLKLGNFLREKGEYNEAIKNFKKAIKLNPGNPQAYNNLGVVFVMLGQKKLATTNFKKAISISENFTTAYYNLSISENFSSKNSDLFKMESIYLKNKIKTEDKINLSFSLGKIYEDLKEYEKAFNYFLEGNTALRKTFNYSIDEDRKFFKNLKNSFNNNTLNELIKIKNNDKSPIFIVGLPRSGTTLVEQILSSHSSVFGLGEVSHLQDLITKYFNPQNNTENENEKSYLERNCKIISEKYLMKVKEKSSNSIRFTDKFPYNFKWIGLIKILFPKSKIIHCKREKRDNCFSIFKTKFFNINYNKWSYDIREIIAYFEIYSELMNHWKQIFPNFIYDISYENLINDNVDESKKLAKFCDLKWEDALLKFYENDRAVKTASLLQVRKPIYKSSVNLWKNFEKQLKKYF